MGVTFSDMVARVNTHTNKPYLYAETVVAVKQATLKMHNLGLVRGIPGAVFYARDLVTTVVTPVQQGSTYRYTIDIPSIPLFRKVNTVRQHNDILTGLEKEFELLAANDIFDQAYKVEKIDYYYVAGTVISINSSIALPNVALSYFSNPNVTEANYSSWIADMDIDAIAVEAARIVFSLSGQPEEANAYKQLSEANTYNLMGIGGLE